MADLSQFIVITHNKETMEAVDTLYGVTMTSLGVSARYRGARYRASEALHAAVGVWSWIRS